MQRIGQCLPSCGLCCKFLELEVNPAYLDAPDVRNWIGLHGIKLQMIDERCIATLPIPCTALAEDKSCSLFGQPSRPELCAEWPQSKAAMAGIKDCGFSFA